MKQQFKTIKKLYIINIVYIKKIEKAKSLMAIVTWQEFNFEAE